MATTPEDRLCAAGQPRTALPRIRELFGDVESFPLFRDIEAACETSVGNYAFAWPLRYPLPATPPHPPDFAGLVSLYCNHLACVVVPRASGSTRPAPPDGTLAIGQLTFLALAAHAYATHLPDATAISKYQDDVIAKLVSGMRIMHPSDDTFWLAARRTAQQTAAAFERGDNTGASSNAIKVLDYCVKLPAVERYARGDALAACYQEGQLLCKAICGAAIGRR